MIMNELITALNFKVDMAGAAKHDRFIRDAQKQAREMFNDFGRQAKATDGHYRDAMGRMRNEHGRFVSEAKRGLGSVKLSVGGLLKSITALGAGFAGFSLAKGLGGGVLQAGMDYERLQAALSTAVGGDKAAMAAYKEIETFARKTPYDLNQVAEAFIKLKNMGLNPSQAALTSYGNTAGAMGKPLSQMIEAVADATTMEFERLKEFGIKSKQSKDTVAFTFRGVTTVVKKNAADIEKFLMKIGNTTFAGGMDKQAATIGGIMSTMSDNFQALGRSIWTGGVGPQAKELIKWISTTTEQILPWVDKYLPSLIDQTIQWAKKGLAILPAALEMTAAGLLGVGVGMAYFNRQIAIGAVSKIVGLTRAFWLLSAAAKAEAISMALANAATFAIPIAIGVAVAAVAWFGWQVYKYMTGGEKAIVGLRKHFPMVADAVRWVAVQVTIWWPVVLKAFKTLGIFIWNYARVPLKFLWEAFKWWIWNITIPGFKIAFALFKTLGGWLSTAYDYWMPKLVAGFYTWKSVLEEVWAWLEPKFNWLFEQMEKAKNMAGGMFEGVASMFGFGGGNGGAGGAPGPGNGNIAETALSFIRSGEADRIAKRDTTTYWAQGKACAWMTEEMVKAAGASQDLLNAMTPSAPDTYNNLLNGGFAEKVPFSQIKPGDLAWKPGNRYHEAMVGPGNTLIEAANSRGHEIGKGQRYVQSHNRFGADGFYLRIKPQYLPQAKTTMPGVQKTNSSDFGGVNAPITQNFYGPANPAQVKQASQEGTHQALTKAGLGRAGAASPR